MLLPDNSIGISDILSWRDCGRRMSFGMRRWTEQGQHPEAESISTAYGSAFHDVVSYAEKHHAFDDEAVQHGFDKWARWLEPDDIARLQADLATYHDRDYLGVRTVANEDEFRVPLMEWEGETIFFRFRLDRLYQSLVDESVFVGVDYKTSRWPKTEEDVHNDVQQWAYNFGIHEVFPEVETLVQIYDQLRFGAVPTRKSPAQREQIREWLVRQVTAILRDDKRGPDGLLLPTKNEWCGHCAIMESCPIVRDYTDFALARVTALAPERKEGRKTVIDLDPDRVQEYVDLHGEVKAALKVLERFDGSISAMVRDMPQERREALGYKTRQRRVDHFPPEALRVAHEVLGDQFYEAIGMSKAAIERLPDERIRTFLLDLAEKKVGSTYIQRAR